MTLSLSLWYTGSGLVLDVSISDICQNIIFGMKCHLYTLSFCCLHTILHKWLFTQRLEIMNLSDFINSKAKYLHQSLTI